MEEVNPELLVYIQTHLAGDLSLEALSDKAALSPAHFHRAFRANIGETPKGYVARLRLERAAFQLSIHDTKLLDIALDCGFQNHETFTRAFRRRFGMPPRLYRDWSRNLTPSSLDAALQPQEQLPPASQAYSISETKIRRLRRVHLAFLRHTGPYEAVPESLFDILGDWAARRGLLADSDGRPPIWMGIGHDAPHTTRPENQRFDAALVVPAAFRAQSGSPIGY
jgi:AraC family transcriptional regulator